MKVATVFTFLCAALFATETWARGGGGGGGRSGGSHSVRGHVTRSGTYVQPHRATNPDSTRLNNWSTRGNVNPYTGQPGTRSPF